MTQPPPLLAPAIDLLRRGDRAGARRALDAALAGAPEDFELLGFAGLLAAQSGDAAAAAPFFRRALAARPGDMATRINLVTALIATGALEEAGDAASAGGDDPRLLRLGAYVHQQGGRLDEAAAAYGKVVAAFPDDFESWNNLGNVRAGQGDAEAALEAFQKAIDLRPDLVQIYMNASEALAAVERNEVRRDLMRDAARLAPDDPHVLTELGLAEASVRSYEEAEAAYREAIRRDPRFLSAYLELGLLFENLNRVDELDALVEQAESSGIADAELGFLKAWSLRRQGKFAEAQPIAEAIPPTIHPVRRAQLVAEIADRLGQTERAFAGFVEMNEASVAIRPAPEGPTYREQVTASAALLTPEWIASWRPLAIEADPPSPIFLIGFPRSGTTLLDTLLMNMPDLHVLEELPAMAQIDHALGSEARLAELDEEEAARLRRLYFQAVDHFAPSPPGTTVVDKHPLRMAGMPVVSRLFPDAKVIFIERHPCDVVLSCFMSNFQLNHAMRSFTTLEEAARTYAAALAAWTRAEALLPLDVHRVRYERMVEDLEGEMRPLLAFLGRDWDPAVLDNQASAAARGHVRTASYAQVTEPIYKRSAGRWERYRAQLEPVLPILAPWIEKLGYPPVEAAPSPAAALEQALARNPRWAEGHVELARLRWAAGDEDGFAGSFEEALSGEPGDLGLWSQYLASLMFAGRHAQLLEAAGRGRAAAGAHPLFDLAEAVAHDDLGDRAAAAPLFEAMAGSADPAAAVYRVRHLLRAGRHDEAAALAERWQETPSGDHFVPYLATAWRLTGDPRWQWLEGDERLVGVYDLADAIGPLEPLAALLRAAHAPAGRPLGQSVRGGTQIDAVLSRGEPEIARVRDAIVEAVARHVAQLPPVDPAHPVLRHRRDAPVRIAGSWSVRLSGAGHHVAHVHPEGWLSSAFYAAVPAGAGPAPAGWLTLGQPPADLGLDLAPIRQVEPKPGRLVLFPATMWHGTVPFAEGERLSIAFDVAHPEPGS
jgi:tetratricopeptide (TPR) repeat protein